jgi:hypothetical protein
MCFNLLYNVTFQSVATFKSTFDSKQQLDMNQQKVNQRLVAELDLAQTELDRIKKEVQHLTQQGRNKLALVEKCLCSDSNFSSFETGDIQDAINSRMTWTKGLPFTIESNLDRYFQAGRDPLNRHQGKDGHTIFDALGPVAPQCRMIETYGAGDEEKRACGVKMLVPTVPCTIISLGSNNQWGFEEAVFREMPNCHIHTFDCTLTGDVRPPGHIASRTTLHPICIGFEDKSDRQGLKFMSWKSIMKLIKMSHSPLYLKMDIEGHEYEVLRNILQENYLLPMQIAMEVHYLTHVDVTWQPRRKISAEIGSFMEFLYHAGGYFLIDRHDNPFCPHCSEILVSRLLCPCNENDESLVSKMDDYEDTATASDDKNPTQLENGGSEMLSLRTRLLDGCGEICRIDTPGTPSKFFDFIKKEVDCDGLWGNSAIDELRIGAPAVQLPAEMLMDFTYNSQVRVVPHVALLDQRYAGGTAETSVWEADVVEDWSQQCGQGTLKGNYGESTTASLLENVRRIPIVGAKVLVIGSENPWVEACLLTAGAEHVTTLEYGKIVSKHSKISTITPHEMRSRFGEFMGFFDAVVTFSSVEHSGLGRYGDQMNPWGDRQAVARAWCLTKPGGYLAIGVPTGDDFIEYNAHRSYGKVMYPHLVANWHQQWQAEGDHWQRVRVFTKAVIGDTDSGIKVAPLVSAVRVPWIGVRFVGRLGNHMFQAASCYGIAKSRGGSCCFLDTSDALEAAVAFNEPFIRCPEIAFRDEMEGTKNQDFVGSLMHGDGDVRVGDFLQSWLYFAGSIPFKLREQEWGMEWVRQHGASVGIHVRRGDMGDNFPASFFVKAISRLRSECEYPILPSAFVVATDDVSWVRRQNVFDAMLVLEGQSAAQDMAILAACKHLIISVGTYGWWAAYMKVKPGIVLHYMPKFEIEDVRDHNATAYYPPGWIGFLYEPGDPCEKCMK